MKLKIIWVKETNNRKLLCTFAHVFHRNKVNPDGEAGG